MDAGTAAPDRATQSISVTVSMGTHRSSRWRDGIVIGVAARPQLSQPRFWNQKYIVAEVINIRKSANG